MLDKLPEDYNGPGDIHEIVSCKMVEQIFLKNRVTFEHYGLNEGHIRGIKSLIKGQVHIQL